jgi:hypothetical protein
MLALVLLSFVVGVPMSGSHLPLSTGTQESQAESLLLKSLRWQLWQTEDS